MSYQRVQWKSNFVLNCRGRIAAVGTTFALLTFAGCGGDWGYLEGTVLLNGQPVGPGRITLQPVNRERAGATAQFGEDGKFQVVSSGRKEGAKTGEYIVTIRGGQNLSEESAGPPPPSRIPARYNSSQTSDLKVTIESGRNTVDFELKP
jgi:hypothetical protein